MTVLTGHLTATEKRHIKAILDRNMTAGQINRKTYHLTNTGEVYTVAISENSTQWCETKPRRVINTHTFKL